MESSFPQRPPSTRHSSYFLPDTLTHIGRLMDADKATHVPVLASKHSQDADSASGRVSRLDAFASLLDCSPQAPEPVVEISSLRRLAARGIPTHPPHLRPTTWSILLGCLPKNKSGWDKEKTNSRTKYAEFATKLLEDVEKAPAPTQPLQPNDRLLDEIIKDVHRTQVHLDFFNLAAPPPPSPDDRPSTIDASLRRSLTRRHFLISSSGKTLKPSSQPSAAPVDSASEDSSRPNGMSSSASTNSLALPHIPELDFGDGSFSYEGPSVDKDESKPAEEVPASSESSSSTAPGAQIELHSDSLTRILFIFSLIHPQLSYTQGYAELLAPIYWVHAGQGSDWTEIESGAFAEADAFWAFLALMGEVGEVVKGPGSRPWGEVAFVKGQKREMDIQWALTRLSARVKWADEALWQDLRDKSLDPAEPYYSFRWVCTLLSQDIPLHSLLRIWDVVLSEPPITHDSLPKVDLLLDVCTAMLLLIRRPLLRAGRRRTQSGLWGELEEQAGDFGPGFVEGMAILQKYPIEEVGVQNIINLALESRQRRILAELDGGGPGDFQEAKVQAAEAQTSTFMRLWKSHRSTPSVGSMSSASTSAEPSSGSSLSRAGSHYGSSLSKYAEAFKESDTAAALSKRSSNLTAAAVARWEDYNKHQRLPVVAEDEVLPLPPQKDHLPPPSPVGKDVKVGSSPRPHFVDPVDADTQPLSTMHLPISVASLASDPSLPLPLSATPTKSLQERLAASLAAPSVTPPSRSHTRSPSSGSKPLLLSSSARPSNSSPSVTSTPTAPRPPWASDSPLSKRSPAGPDRATSPPPHFAQSASDGESSRIPIGGSRRRSSQLGGQTGPLSPPPAVRTTFLKTTPKAQEAGIKLRQPTLPASTSSPSPVGRASPEYGSQTPRGLPRSPRSKGFGRPESFSSTGDSDADRPISSRLSHASSGDGSQRGWTLVDNGSAPAPLSTRTSIASEGDLHDKRDSFSSARSQPSVAPPLDRLVTRDLAYAASPTKATPQSAASHTRNQSSASSLGAPASPMGPRPPRKTTSSRTPVTPKKNRPGRETSDRDADDEDSTTEILDSYGQA